MTARHPAVITPDPAHPLAIPHAALTIRIRTAETETGMLARMMDIITTVAVDAAVDHGLAADRGIERGRGKRRGRETATETESGRVTGIIDPAAAAIMMTVEVISITPITHPHTHRRPITIPAPIVVHRTLMHHAVRLASSSRALRRLSLMNFSHKHSKYLVT